MTHPAESNLNNPELTTILFAILVKRLGGKAIINQAIINQADIDDTAYNRMEEEGYEDGTLEFRIAERRAAS